MKCQGSAVPGWVSGIIWGRRHSWGNHHMFLYVWCCTLCFCLLTHTLTLTDTPSCLSAPLSFSLSPPLSLYLIPPLPPSCVTQPLWCPLVSGYKIPSPSLCLCHQGSGSCSTQYYHSCQSMLVITLCVTHCVCVDQCLIT